MEKKAHPSEIVIEIEQIEIDAAHARDADEDELLGNVGDDRIETSDLPVEAIAVRSVPAAKDDEQRFTAFARRFASLFPIVEPRRSGLFAGRAAPAAEATQNKENRRKPPPSAHNLTSRNALYRRGQRPSVRVR